MSLALFRDMAALFSKKRVVRHEEKKLTLGKPRIDLLQIGLLQKESREG